LWVGLWASLGYAAGDRIVTIYRQIGRYELYLGAALVLLVAAAITRHLLRRRRGAGIGGRPVP
jgi:membrane protein DedA with SNARE-associated domain